jgi:hypothetical protein
MAENIVEDVEFVNRSSAAKVQVDRFEKVG